MAVPAIFTASLLLAHAAGQASGSGCGFPGAPAHSTVTFSPSDDNAREGTIAEYSCDRGFELLGPARRVCGANGTWSPQGIPFCVLNVAAGKAPMQSSVAEGGIPQKAVDGSTSTFFDLSTCSLTEVEKSPWWYVNLLEPYMVQLVRIDFGQSCCAKGRQATIVVRVGNNRPDLGVNPICNRFTGVIEEGRPLFLPCNPPMPGAFVSIHFEGPPGVSLSICEAFVYTDQALPIERCPTFRDQPPGSTATYNGKCYIFYNQQPTNFQGAMEFCTSRGGTLVDESNPALQGFLSWELWRRHKGDANGQYWLGAIRDTDDPKNWKWIDGKTVTVSFWNLPGGNENCARFDGTKGWLWSDTNCGLKLNFICQHRPTTCGKPEQPPNSTLIATDFAVGNRIQYSCDEGHLLVGPTQRTCLPTGFYSEFPPVCRFLECGLPADIPNAKLLFVNGTRAFQSVIAYQCNPGYTPVGRTTLMCDVDERWNGPPPRCDPVFCPEPASIRNGGFSLSSNSTAFGTIASYYCTSNRHVLFGVPKLNCLKDGSWDAEVPECRLKKVPTTIGAGSGVRPSDKNPSSIAPGGANSPGGQGGRFQIDRDTILRRPILKAKLPNFKGEEGRPIRRKKPLFPPNFEPDVNSAGSNPDPRFPIRNEIPDSANVQANEGPRADVPPVSAVQNDRESSYQQLNVGGMISIGVFGGFVFLAAVITVVVILVKRKDPSRPIQHRHHRHSHSGSSSTDTGSSRENDSRRYREEVRDESEMVISAVEKPKHHHHHHHHRHKHRPREDSSSKSRY